jgi:hypothetical protein
MVGKHTPLVMFFGDLFVSDAAKRPGKGLHTNGTLREFVLNADNPSLCQNLMDYCTFSQDSPLWFQYVNYPSSLPVIWPSLHNYQAFP